MAHEGDTASSPSNRNIIIGTRIVPRRNPTIRGAYYDMHVEIVSTGMILDRLNAEVVAFRINLFCGYREPPEYSFIASNWLPKNKALHSHPGADGTIHERA